MKKVHLEAVSFWQKREIDLVGKVSANGAVISFNKRDFQTFLDTLNAKRLYVVWNETGKEVISSERLSSTNG